jgi:acyl-lipid omega-6 desaturase (Delta-12 desaturase)
MTHRRDATKSSPLPPLALDEQVRAEGTKIGDLRDLIPKECHELRPLRAWGGLARAVLVLALSVLLLSRIEPAWGPGLVWQIPALAAAWLFAGWCFTGLFVIGHDCGHMAFSRRRWVNEVVGHLCLSPEFTGYHNWRIWHNHHHGKTQMRAVDPDWAELMMTRAEYDRAPLGDKAHVRLGFGTPLGILVGFWKGMLRRTFMKTMAPNVPLTRDAPRELFMSSAIMIAASGAISVWLALTGGAWALVKYYLVPTFIAAAHGAMLTYLHHTSADALVFDRADWTPMRGQVISTFNVRFPRVIEALWFDINIHLPHHLAPRIPWYHLKTAAAAIQAARPDLVQERRFSLAYLRASWARPLLARAASGDAYEMAPFDGVAEERPEATPAASSMP